MKASLDSRSFVPSLDAFIFAMCTGAAALTFVDKKLAPIAVLLIGGYWTLDFFAAHAVGRSWLHLGKLLIVVVTIVVVVVFPMLSIIVVRHQTASYLYAHDGLIQSEAATQFVMRGLNPYIEDYTHTPLAQWHFEEGSLTVNPALYHNAYLPLTFLLPLPFQALAEATIGWFDQRFVYLALFVIMLMLIGSLTYDPSKRLTLLIILGLNPLFTQFLLEGRNDILTLFWLIIAVVLLRREKIVTSAVAVACACVTKQTAWFFVPFYLVYVGRDGRWADRIGRIKKPFAVLMLVGAIVVLPWLLWNPSAFLGDIFYFQSGLAPGGYPINGVGFGALLLSLGVVKSNVTPFPFWIFQVVVGLPLLVMMVRRQWQRRSLRTAIIGYMVLLFAIAYFAQFFNTNYLGFMVELVALAVFMDDNESNR